MRAGSGGVLGGVDPGAGAGGTKVIGSGGSSVDGAPISEPGPGPTPGSGCKTTGIGPDLGRWQHVDSTKWLPDDAFPTGGEGSAARYTCRASYMGQTEAGKAFPEGGCNFAANGAEQKGMNYDVLIGDTYDWQAATAPLTAIPAQAVVAGRECDGAPQYACRVSYQGGLHPGKLVGGRCVIGYAGAEVPSDTFEVLLFHDWKADPLPIVNGELIWPNAVSAANSDPWLSRHHNQLTQLRPRALVVSFANGNNVNAVNVRWNELSAALNEGSRYHGYNDPTAKPFVQHQLVKLVDLTDRVAPPGWTAPNSTKMPRLNGGIDFGKLYGQDFADLYGVPDPANPSRNLGLCEMVQKGVINELFIAFNKTGTDGNVPEVIEYKQMYDGNDRPLPGQFDPYAGNGAFSPADLPEARACGRSLRVDFIEMTGILSGALHVFSHNLEHLGGALPNWNRFFASLFNFNLSARFKTPFDSWYDLAPSLGAPHFLSYPSQTSVQWNCQPDSTVCAGKSGTITGFGQGCGNTHFAPNSQVSYDMTNTTTVLTSCEHYGLHDGPGGMDLQTPYNAATVQQLANKYGGDGNGGGWQIYLMQSLPGFQTKARNDDGTPIKNSWPYLYY